MKKVYDKCCGIDVHKKLMVAMESTASYWKPLGCHMPLGEYYFKISLKYFIFL